MICTICKLDKNDDFRKSRKVCRDCDNKLQRERNKKDIEKNKPNSIICNVCNLEKSEFRINRKKCLDCERKHGKKYRQITNTAKMWVENNKEQMSILQHKWYTTNKKEIGEKRKERLKIDPFFKLVESHRNGIRNLFKKTFQKSKYVNCSSYRLIHWIMYQFTNEMTIENYNIVWVFDHVLPIDLFLSKKYKESIILNWVNIRPVLKKYNLTKNKFIDNNQCTDHLQTLKKYYKSEKLNEDVEYLQILEILSVENRRP